MNKAIWAVIAVLLGSWVIGLVLKVAEGAIHLLLVPAVMLGVFNFMRGRSGGDLPATE